MVPKDGGEAVVYRCSTRAAAEWIQSVLKENGVDSRVLADDCGGLRPELLVTQEVEVRVQAKDEVAALQILKSLSEEDDS